jgi:2-polyprenyl-6-methoxyphenol hydroxylase-like FAD-dependent oxidoreductase
MPGIDADVVVAGGGVAGVSAAAALREFGWRVLVVEPGQRAERRLAGELIHPPGVDGLAELGLYDRTGFAAAVPIRGFCVFQDGDQRGTELPYDRRASRMAVGFEHGAIRASLEASAEQLPHVTLWRGARVVGLDLAHRAGPRVSIEQSGKVETVGCRMVIGADGATSVVRGLSGITHTRRRLSNITGYLIDRDALPAPGFGHVFMSKAAPLLAYEIGGGRARVLFDRPLGSDESPAEHRRRVIAGLPPALQAALAAAVERQRGLGFVSAEVLVGAAGRGPLALVGDAGGSCHPLTATGLSVGIGDALRLRQALRDCDGDIGRSVALYAKRRRAPQRARLLLASSLHEACSGQDASSQLVRKGLIDYWQRDARGREASMALLAMTDTRVAAIVREMARILLLGVTRATQQQGTLRVRLSESTRLTWAMSALLMRHVPMAVKAR